MIEKAKRHNSRDESNLDRLRYEAKDNLCAIFNDLN